MSADYDNIILFLNMIVINKYFYYHPSVADKSLSDVTQAFSIHMTFGITTK